MRKGSPPLSARRTNEGDHRGFEAVGLPAFDFIQDPLDFAMTRHSNLDTYERLQPAALMQNAHHRRGAGVSVGQPFRLLPRLPLPQPDVNAAGPWSPGR